MQGYVRIETAAGGASIVVGGAVASVERAGGDITRRTQAKTRMAESDAD